MSADRQIGRYSGKPTGGRPPGLAPYLKNGKLPDNVLASTEPYGKVRLWKPAAEHFRQLCADAQRLGVKILAVSGYRTFASQAQMRAIWTKRGKPDYAAVPGTSSHGWGTAVDINHRGPGVLGWMKRHAPAFGWDHPIWAGDGKGVEEPWHWQYVIGHTHDPQYRAGIAVLVTGKRVQCDAELVDGRVWVDLVPVLKVTGNAYTVQPSIASSDKLEAMIVSSHLRPVTVTVPVEMVDGSPRVMARALGEALRLPVSYAAGVLKIG